MIAILTKFLPFIGPLLERFFPDKSRVAELQAEKELVEAQAFKRGRISPKYWLGYVVVILLPFLDLRSCCTSSSRLSLPFPPWVS